MPISYPLILKCDSIFIQQRATEALPQQGMAVGTEDREMKIKGHCPETYRLVRKESSKLTKIIQYMFSYTIPYTML